MICLNCNCEQFKIAEAPVRQEFRGQTLMVKTPGMQCTKCNWFTVGNDQIDELRKRTADAYRKANGLLTSAEIVARRKTRGQTQEQFAAFLRVGVASLKRWESWQVQDPSSDELIRLKCANAAMQYGDVVTITVLPLQNRVVLSKNQTLSHFPSLKDGNETVRLISPSSVTRGYVGAPWFSDRLTERYTNNVSLAPSA